MKFTQEDLLNAAGLKLGDKILFAFYGSPVTVSYNELDGFHFMADNGKHFYIQTLIDHDYTRIIQPKYTLTEDDKKLVMSIELVGVELKDQLLSRNSNGYLHLSVHEKNVLFLNDDLLKCIENNNSVSLDELKEIAKK